MPHIIVWLTLPPGFARLHTHGSSKLSKLLLHTHAEGGQMEPPLGGATFDEIVSLIVYYEKDGGELLSSGADLLGDKPAPRQTRYRPLSNVPRTNRTSPATTNQKATPARAGMVPREAKIPSAPRITAIHHVITLGLLSFMIFFSLVS
jgi:hypothetical protein